MSLSAELLGKVKTALLDCEAKSEQLEEAARQLTVQKLRSQLAIETRLSSLEQQLRDAGQQLLTELVTHHDSWQAKIYQQEHLVLKRSMQLSSAMAKEMVSPALLTKLDDNLDVDLCGLHDLQFKPANSLHTIVKSDIGFLQPGQGGVGTVGLGEVVEEKWDASRRGLDINFDYKTEDIKEDKSQGVLALTESGGVESASGCEEILPAAISGDSPSVTLKVLSRAGTDFHEVVNDVTDMLDDAADYTVAQKESSRPPSPSSCVAPSTTSVDSHVGQKESSRPPSSSPSVPPSTTSVDSHAQPHPALGSDKISFRPGSSCLALWTEDSVWYRAIVDSITEEVYQVTFIDYGNTVTVSLDQMVAKTENIPKEQLDMVDNFVWETDGGPSKWSVDMSCIAKWSEDNIWYNGVVTAVSGGGQYTVLFSDYGNMELVSEESLVETPRDIPAGDIVDLCVEREDTAKGQESMAMFEEIKDEFLIDTAEEIEGQCEELLEGTDEKEEVKEEVHADDPNGFEARMVDISDSCSTPQDISQDTVTPSRTGEEKKQAEVPTKKGMPNAQIRRFEAGSSCIALWSEDNTWYNGLVIKVNKDGSFQVKFVDYGNVETVAADKIVEEEEEIPALCKVDQWVGQGFEDRQVEMDEGDIPVKEDIDLNEETFSPELEERSFNEGKQKTEEDSVADSIVTIITVIPRPLKTDQAQTATIADQPCTNLPDQNQTVSPPSPGQLYLARWTVDHVWYNARVDQLLPGGKQVLVTFTDYGNTDQLPVGELYSRHALLPQGDKVDVHVKQECVAQPADDQVEAQPSPLQDGDGLTVGDQCVALWAEDNIWYNARVLEIDQQGRVAQVVFFDYGNIDKVSLGDMYKTFSSVPLHRSGELITVDPHVKTGHVVEPAIMSLLPLVNTDQHGKKVLTAVVVHSIPGMVGEVGLAVLQKGTLVTAMEKDNKVKMWSREGEDMGEVVAGRQYRQPVDVVSLGSGGFAVRDKEGIMVFSMKGEFIKELVVDKLDTCSGLTVDGLGRIVTINRCLEGDKGELTMRGETDIIYIDVEKEKIVKRVEMIDIIEDRVKTNCMALVMYRDKLYVVDTGLDCIYTLFHEDGEDQAEVFGTTGRQETQFSGVSSVVVDDEGNMVISDTRNNRLQVVNSESEFVCFVKVLPWPLSKPSIMCLDREVGQLVVHNSGKGEVVRYSLGQE